MAEANLRDILPAELNYPRPRLPFGDVWRRYADAGLRPVPVQDTPPTGFLKWSRMKAEQWAANYRWSHAQTAITLPDGLVILDDDDAGKVAGLEAELGSRPKTLYGTSRGAGAVRRKSLYRIPPGSRFVGEYSGGEVIDSRHRFAFVCPTVNRKTGEVEQWYSPGDTPLERFPTAEDLADMVAVLPAAWVAHLTSVARHSDATQPYDGPVRFDGGELSQRVLEVAERHPDTSHYPEANSALMSLAWVAARFPEAEGIETLRAQIVNAYVLRSDARTEPAEREASMDRAWVSALATQAAQHEDEWSEIEAEVGAASAAWYRSNTFATPAEPRAFSDILPDDAYKRARQGDFSAFERAVMGDASGYAEERAQTALEAAQPERNSWAPRDLSDVMAGDYVAPKPTVFRRTDGMGMFYPGVVNEFHAVGGTGKTLAALAVCDEALRDGQTVLYVDYEEHPARIVQRLRGYGISDEAIQSRFMYVKPIEKPTQAALDALVNLSPSVVIIDTFAESFNNMTGGDSHRTDDVTAWFSLPRLFADAGACVIVTDHIPKDAQNKLMPIGSQAKHSGYKGAIYFLEAPTGAGLLKGEHGRLRFILGKDNGGEMGVRTGECAATFHLDATGEVSMWELQAPDTGTELAEAAAALSADRERIAEALPVHSRAQLWEALNVNKNSTPGLKAALGGMIEDGSVIEEKVGNAHRLRLASNKAPTREADAEAALWEGFVPRPDHVPMSPAPVPGDKEDVESDIHRIQLDVHRDEFTAHRSPYEGISDSEIDDVLGETHAG